MAEPVLALDGVETCYGLSQVLFGVSLVIAPGEIFSQQGAWNQHLRLSYSLDWDKNIAHAVQRLAQAITEENRVYSP